MSKRTLPNAPSGRPQIAARSYVSPVALSRWDSGLALRAESSPEEERTIGIYDVIGEDWWTGGGFTSKRMAAALRSLGKGPVTVAINSPGGDFFEGLSMYAMLREHNGDVTVKVMGLAASAASIIAMGGDDVQISRAGFLMIHNTWMIAAGNRHDLRDLADQIEPFDTAMADIYAARTGDSAEAMGKLMDRESWIGGAAAVSQGFADSLLSSDSVETKALAGSVAAVRRMEAALRASGMSKVEAMRLISEFKSSAGDPRAGSGTGEPSGHNEPVAPRDEEAVELFASLRAFQVN